MKHDVSILVRRRDCSETGHCASLMIHVLGVPRRNRHKDSYITQHADDTSLNAVLTASCAEKRPKRGYNGIIMKSTVVA